MRLIEFIIQEAFYLDGNYGTWIDTKTNEIIDVESHIDYLTLRYENRKTEYGAPYRDDNGDVEDYPEEHFNKLYHRAFKEGLVRTVHEPHGTINISGTAKALKKAWKFIRSRAISEETVYVSIVKGLNNDNDYTFELPKDKAKLIKLMNSL